MGGIRRVGEMPFKAVWREVPFKAISYIYCDYHSQGGGRQGDGSKWNTGTRKPMRESKPEDGGE